MITACKLNNKNMRGLRRSEEYQCIMVDLAMLGVISKEECEMLIGGRIPNNLTLPNGKQGHLISEENLPEQPVRVENANVPVQVETTPVQPEQQPEDTLSQDMEADLNEGSGSVPVSDVMDGMDTADVSTPDLTLNEGSGLVVPDAN